MKRYVTALALLGILGFCTVSFAEDKASEAKETKEIASSICNSDSTGQGIEVGSKITVNGKKFTVRSIDAAGKPVLEEVE